MALPFPFLLPTGCSADGLGSRLHHVGEGNTPGAVAPWEGGGWDTNTVGVHPGPRLLGVREVTSVLFKPLCFVGAVETLSPRTPSAWYPRGLRPSGWQEQATLLAGPFWCCSSHPTQLPGEVTQGPGGSAPSLPCSWAPSQPSLSQQLLAV